MKSLMAKQLFLTYSLFFSSHICAHYIFQNPAPQAGDNLVALYIAYPYAKKYNLTLAITPFNHYELFKCSSLLPQLPTDILSKQRKNVIQVNIEQDILNNLHKPNVHFLIHVLSDRLPMDKIAAAEATKLLMLDENMNFDHLPKEYAELTIAVHIRKGNGGGQFYDGELGSEQIFNFNHSIMQYSLDTTNNPFNYFEAEENAAFVKDGPPGLKTPDVYWKTKFPPEQYYIDQINKVIAEKNVPTIVRIFTDDKNPLALVKRIKKHINNPLVRVEHYDNRGKDFGTMMVEDLYLMSQCDVLIRSTSRFAIVAEVIGHYKTVLFPIKGLWLGKKLIIYQVGIRCYTNY